MSDTGFMTLEHCALSALDHLEELRQRRAAPRPVLTGIRSIDVALGDTSCCELAVLDVDTPARATALAARCSINLAAGSDSACAPGQGVNVLLVSMRLQRQRLARLLARMHSGAVPGSEADARDALLAVGQLPISVIDEASFACHDLLEHLMKAEVLRRGRPSALLIDGPERLDWYQVWNRRAPGLSPVLTDLATTFGRSAIAVTARSGSPQEAVLRQAVLEQASVILRLLALPVSTQGAPGGTVFELVRHRHLPPQLVVVGPQELPWDLSPSRADPELAV